MKLPIKALYLTCLMVFYLSTAGWLWTDSVAKKNKQAVHLYKEDKIDDALSKWRDAQIDSPDKKELYYNIGGALMRQKKHEDAYKQYEKSLDSKDTGLRSKTYYNMGNANYRMGKLPEAIEYYEKCLDINPEDEDAKYNIEFIKKKNSDPRKEEDSRESNQAEDQKQQGQSGEQKETGERESGKEEKAEEKQEKDKENKKGMSGQEDAGSDKKEEKKEGKMSEEDALRLLDALKDDEKDLRKQLRIPQGENGYRVEKDW
jgi:Ca-activated chloride channel homolog